MTQTVTDEKGMIHNFPDDATPEEMNAALGQSDQINGPLREPALAASNVVQGAAQLGNHLGSVVGGRGGHTPASWGSRGV